MKEPDNCQMYYMNTPFAVVFRVIQSCLEQLMAAIAVTVKMDVIGVGNLRGLPKKLSDMSFTGVVDFSVDSTKVCHFYNYSTNRNHTCSI